MEKQQHSASLGKPPAHDTLAAALALVLGGALRPHTPCRVVIVAMPSCRALHGLLLRLPFHQFVSLNT